jgi:ABC-type amino acid transport substrate-binding protein
MNGVGDMKVLRVGIDDAPPVPMQMGSPESGDFKGYEVSLLEMLKERLGCGLQYRRALWSVIVRELIAGEIDIVCSAATVTKEREREVSFCRPHLRLALAAVVRKDMQKTIEWECDRFGIRAGTTAEDYLLAKTGGRAAAMRSESNDELYAALEAGEIDAVVDDSPIALHFVGARPALQYAGWLEGTESAYAIMLRTENNELRERIDGVLQGMETDGTLTDLRMKWFGTCDVLIA